MGLFVSKTADVDVALEALIVASPDGRKAALKSLAANQDGIKGMLAPDEVAEVISYYMGNFGGDMLLVITNLRSVAMKKGSIKQQLRHDEVAGTTIAQMANGQMLVQIESTASRLDYRPNDTQRFESIMQMQIYTPRQAQTICQAVDRYISD